jgi:hypothetical protein
VSVYERSGITRSGVSCAATNTDASTAPSILRLRFVDYV